MRNRRELLTHLGLGAAGCALVFQPSAGHAAITRFEEGNQAPWWLIEPLAPGEHLGAGWRVLSLTPVRQGAAVMTIRHPYEGTLPIHICTHDGAPRGYASSELFDLIVMDKGHGHGVVSPELGAVFNHIADQIRSNELREGPSARLEDIQTMMTHPERVRAFGSPQLQEAP